MAADCWDMIVTLRVAMQAFFVRSHIRTSESSPAVTSFSSLGLNATCRTRPLCRAHEHVSAFSGSVLACIPPNRGRPDQMNLRERLCVGTAPCTQHTSESCLLYQGKDCLLPSSPCRAVKTDPTHLSCCDRFTTVSQRAHLLNAILCGIAEGETSG